jgi:hypothetical protein
LRLRSDDIAALHTHTRKPDGVSAPKDSIDEQPAVPSESIVKASNLLKMFHSIKHLDGAEFARRLLVLQVGL